MRWFGTVYTPLMAVLGLLFIVISMFVEHTDTSVSPATYMMAGSILAAGACIAGALRREPPKRDE